MENSVTARMALAKKIFEDMQGFLCTLHSRWQDEKKYEDFADYKAAIVKALAAYPVSDISVEKQPFTVSFTLLERVYVITVKANEYSYKRMS